MVRTYKRKTERATISEKCIDDAVSAVIKDKIPYRVAAKTFGLKPSMLFNRVSKFRMLHKELNETDPEPTSKREFCSKYAARQVFTNEQEILLEGYLKKSSKMQYGLTYKCARQMAYSYAKFLKRPYPPSWDIKKLAGIEWIKGFMKRHKSLSLRKPENTSMNRSSGFSKANVQEFQNNYEYLLQKFQFTPEKIFNLDETGITTVLQAPKVIATSGVKQVGQTVSSERGELVTFCGIINALGNTIPPVYVFPRKRNKELFSKGAPPLSLSLVHPTGWMTSDNFLETMKHFQKFCHCKKEDPVLLLLDNHECHTSLEVILFCRENGIVLLSFPPHCSHKLQPLDVSVYGPFKAALKTAFNDWLTNNAGKRISIYEIAGLSATAYYQAFTIRNIRSRFSKPGIWPFSRNIFAEKDFLADIATHEKYEVATPSTSGYSIESNNQAENVDLNTSTISTCPTPESIRPFPKPKRNNLKKRKREKGKSRILTDTPEKDRIAEATNKKVDNKKKKLERALKKKEKSTVQLLRIMKKRKAKILYESESECSFNEEKEFQEDDLNDSPYVLEINDFVLVEYSTKKTKVHYVGRIENLESDEACITFMRKQTNDTFIFPEKDDTATVQREDIIMKLPQPSILGGTSRAMSSMSFSVKLDQYNVR